MTERNLFRPVTDQGVRNPYFFEGRLLSGQDLREQLDARTQHDRYLGRALGSGIVHGLGVSIDNGRDGGDGQPPVVRVRKGLAINRLGDVIGLPQSDIQLALSRSLEEPRFEAVDFRNCAGIPRDRYVPNGIAVYLLLMTPAAQFRERVPKSGLGDEGIARGCGSRYIQEGVEFRLLELPLSSLGSVASSLVEALQSGLLDGADYARKSDLQRLSLLKNQLAAICTGARQVLADSHTRDLVGAPRPVLPGAVIDELIERGDLCAEDVPLSLFYWSPEGLAFVDNWAVRRLADPGFCAGRLRLAQFTDHLSWLNDRLGTSPARRLDRYFRFVPPAALIPARIGRDEHGFRLVDFLSGYYRGVTDRVNTGQINRMLDDSLGYPTLDLQEPAYLGVLTASDTSDLDVGEQRYALYFARDLLHSDLRDDIAQAIRATWDVYRILVRRQVFQPPATDAEKITARQTIANAFDDVLAIANRHSAPVASGGRDIAGTLRVFRDLFDVQQDMVEIFAEPIAGIEDTQSREVFTENIRHILTVSTPLADGPSYRAAMDNGSLYEALDAQIAINRFVGEWTGEGVAVGPFGFAYAGSPGENGATLVPGAEASPHLFTLSNGTNKSVTFDLSIEVSAETGDWSNSATILRSQGGSPINELAVPSGEQATIAVMVAAPEDAQVGEAVRVQLAAAIGSPTNRRNVYDSSELLEVGEEGEGPVAGTLTIENVQLLDFAGSPVDRENLSSGDFIFLRMGVSFQIQELDQTDVAVDILVQTEEHDHWDVLNVAGSEPLEEDPENVYSIVWEGLQGGGEVNTQDICTIRVPAPDAGSNTLEFRLRVRTAELEEEISTMFDETIALTVSGG